MTAGAQLELFTPDKPRAFEKLLFSTTCRYYELEAIARAKPQHVLLSYAHWKNKHIQTHFIERVGYRPETIIVDSGAYTFYNSGEQTGIRELFENYGHLTPSSVAQLVMRILQSHSPQDIRKLSPLYRYLQWLEDNEGCYDTAIQMDEIKNGYSTMFAYEVLRILNIPFMPVFQYGADKKLLEALVSSGEQYICLGGTANMRLSDRFKWARPIIDNHPHIRFHMLGTMNQKLIDKLPGLYSADGTSWITEGKNRAFYNGEDRLAATTDEILKRIASYQL